MTQFSAAIDFGSNSFRLLVAQADSPKATPIIKELRTVRLGEELHKSDLISQIAMKRALAAVSDFSKIINTFPDIKIRACGTAALRLATNSAEFIKAASTILETDVEVISSEQEAQLTMAGCCSHSTQLENPVCVIDSGGGSTELILNNGASIFSLSKNVGAVNLTESFFHGEIPKKNELQSLKNHLCSTFKDIYDLFSSKLPSIHAVRLIGCGGCATAMAALDMELSEYNSELINDYSLPANRLMQHYEKLIILTDNQRNNLPGLDHDRGEIIIAGLMVILSIIKNLKVDTITISDSGLLEGILLSIKS